MTAMTPLAAAQTAITAAFESSYGRAPTAVEMTYWSNNWQAGEVLATITAAIAADGAKGVSSVPSGAVTSPTPAATATPPATTIDNTTFVNLMYLLFFQRVPAPSEVSFYLNAFAAGTTTQAQVFNFFSISTENEVRTLTLTGTATDVANRQTVRNASFTGGNPGDVSGPIRNVDNVGAGVTSFEWVETNILNSAANAGENVAGYNQANGTGTGEVWASVAEVHQAKDAPAVGLEIDVQKAAGTADGIGLDIVNYGNETVEIQGGDGEIIWRDRSFDGRSGRTLTCIRSLTGGGIAIEVRGTVVASWA